jgi:hypothetical protein
MKTKNKKNTKKKTWIIIGSILLVLVIARLMLPYFVTRYVNKVLSEIPGYWGSITDVDIHLIRGAYVIQELKLFKVNGNERVPFIDIPATDLSVEWKAIFDGAIVGEVIFIDPKLNFIGGDQKNSKGETGNQTGEDVDWTAPIKKLMPLQINRLEIERGSIFFYDFTTKPNVNVNLNDLNLLATNLNNAENQKKDLPSTVKATATSIGKGQLSINMNINVLKKIPDLDMDFKFENIDMPALNDFFLAYARVDIERGTFNLYSEMVIDDGIMQGYVKPIAQNVKVVNWKEDKKNPLNLVWQSVVGFFVEIFENQKKDQFATKVPLTGDLNNVETATWPSVWNIFRNAFVKAFEKNTDNTVKFKAVQEPEKEKESKRDKRKKKKALKKDAAEKDNAGK